MFVPYGETPDFYYSGHVGSCMIHFFEFQANGLFWLSLYALFTMACQIFTMYALRDHYTIDMFGGIIIGHYTYIMAERYCYIIDYYVFGIPIEKRIGTIE